MERKSSRIRQISKCRVFLLKDDGRTRASVIGGVDVGGAGA